MSALLNINAFLNTLTTTSRSLPVIILYVTEGCNLRCITCSYRQPPPGELSLHDMRNLSARLHSFGLRHIVYSGGEPLLRKELPEICQLFDHAGVKQTLLTNGLLLEKRYSEIRSYFSEIIVSLDGANAETHDAIRGVKSFEQIFRGIASVVDSNQPTRVSLRMVVQKQNFRELPDMVELAKRARVGRISFLAADVLSDSFGRDTRGAVAPDERVMLDNDEVNEFRLILQNMEKTFADEFASHLISDSISKLYHIAQYFEALLGKAPFPKNICNAPMVSAVITSTGKIKPCFFLPEFGDVINSDIGRTANLPTIRKTRHDVKAYSLERCQKCVCTLHVDSLPSLLNRF